MPPPIERLTQQFMADPVRIDITPEGKAAQGISHRLYLVEPENRKACLLALLHQELGSTLVFIRRKTDAEWLSGVLEREGHPVERIHSNLSQGQRVLALQGLREGEHRILVATDIAARGIDIPVIDHIVNFNVPESVEDYVHRAGRTAGGVGSTIATWQDRELVRAIEQTLGQTLPRCAAPGVEPYVEKAKSAPKRRRRHRGVPVPMGEPT